MEEGPVAWDIPGNMTALRALLARIDRPADADQYSKVTVAPQLAPRLAHPGGGAHARGSRNGHVRATPHVDPASLQDPDRTPRSSFGARYAGRSSDESGPGSPRSRAALPPSPQWAQFASTTPRLAEATAYTERKGILVAATRGRTPGPGSYETQAMRTALKKTGGCVMGTAARDTSESFCHLDLTETRSRSVSAEPRPLSTPRRMVSAGGAAEDLQVRRTSRGAAEEALVAKLCRPTSSTVSRYVSGPSNHQSSLGGSSLEDLPSSPPPKLRTGQGVPGRILSPRPAERTARQAPPTPRTARAPAYASAKQPKSASAARGGTRASAPGQPALQPLARAPRRLSPPPAAKATARTAKPTGYHFTAPSRVATGSRPEKGPVWFV